MLSLRDDVLSGKGVQAHASTMAQDSGAHGCIALPGGDVMSCWGRGWRQCEPATATSSTEKSVKDITKPLFGRGDRGFMYHILPQFYLWVVSLNLADNAAGPVWSHPHAINRTVLSSHLRFPMAGPSRLPCLEAHWARSLTLLMLPCCLQGLGL